MLLEREREGRERQIGREGGREENMKKGNEKNVTNLEHVSNPGCRENSKTFIIVINNHMVVIGNTKLKKK